MEGGGPPRTIGDVIGERLLHTLEAAEEKLDDEIDKLERLGEDEMERMRRKRMDDLKKSHQQKQAWALQGHGDYRECPDQKQFFDDLRKEARAVVHFARPATRRCEILDKHLAVLARKHIETKFMRVDAEKSPFLAERLKIWMLPTLVLVKDGKTDHSIVGFDELGGKDDFAPAVLEQLLLKYDAVLESFC